MGRALAFQMDKHVLQMMVAAANESTANVGDTSYPSGTVITDADANTNATSLISSIFSAAETLDDNYVPAEETDIVFKTRTILSFSKCYECCKC